MLAQGRAATKLKIDFEGQIHMNSQGKSKQVEVELPLDSPMGKLQIFLMYNMVFERIHD